MMSSLPRLARPIAVSAALLALTTACAGPRATPPAPTAPPTASGSPTPATVSSLSMQASGVELAITAAAVHVTADGTNELTMTVRNSGSVPEHLAMVTASGGQATLQGAASATDGSLSSAGDPAALRKHHHFRRPGPARPPPRRPPGPRPTGAAGHGVRRGRPGSPASPGRRGLSGRRAGHPSAARRRRCLLGRPNLNAEPRRMPGACPGVRHGGRAVSIVRPTAVTPRRSPSWCGGGAGR